MKNMNHVSKKAVFLAGVAIGVAIPGAVMATIIPANALIGDDFNPPMGNSISGRTPDLGTVSPMPTWIGLSPTTFVPVTNVSPNPVNTDTSSSQGRTSSLRNSGGGTHTASAYLPIPTGDGLTQYVVSTDVERVSDLANTTEPGNFAGLFLARSDNPDGSGNKWNYFGNNAPEAGNGQMLIGLVESDTRHQWNFVVEQSGGTFGTGGVDSFPLTNNTTPGTAGFNEGGWNNVSVQVDFASNTLKAYLNGTLMDTVTPTIPLAQGAVGTANAISMFGVEMTSTDSTTNFFDNFSIQPASVPEPAALAAPLLLLALGGVRRPRSI